MFVITIGPIGKNWGRALKLIAIGLVLLLIFVIAWRMIGTLTRVESDQSVAPEVIRDTMSQLSGGGALSFWQRWLGSLRQWFEFGF